MTDTEPNTLEENLNSQKWWTKFDKITGKVFAISPKPFTGNLHKNHAVLEGVHQSEFDDVITGKLSLRKVKVIEDIGTNELKVVTQSNSLTLRAISDKLHHITAGVPAANAMNIEYFTQTDIFTVSLNLEVIKQKMALQEIHQLNVHENTMLNLFITRKNDPDALLAIIEVDPILLFKNKSLDIKANLQEHIEPSQVSIYTAPVFHSYSLQLNHTQKATESTNYQQHKYLQQVVNTNKQQHLTINKTGDNEVVINSGLLNEANYYLLDGSTNINFLVCEMNQPDSLCGAFSISSQNLLKNNSNKIKLKFNMPENPMMIYQCRNLLVNYIGD